MLAETHDEPNEIKVPWVPGPPSEPKTRFKLPVLHYILLALILLMLTQTMREVHNMRAYEEFQGCLSAASLGVHCDYEKW